MDDLKNRRLVSTLHSSLGIKTRTYWDEDAEEFQVELFVGRVLQYGATYHTQDSADALGTATAMIRKQEALINADEREAPALEG